MTAIDVRMMAGLLTTVLVGSFGCEGASIGGEQPMIWPLEARYGTTVAFMIDTNVGPFTANERYDVTEENLKLELQPVDGAGTPLAGATPLMVVDENLSPGAGEVNTLIGVVEVKLPSAAVAVEAFGVTGAVGVVAIFDLPVIAQAPAGWPAPPFQLRVTGVYDDGAGYVSDPSYSNELTLLSGGDGAPTQFGFVSHPTLFELRPMVRLRPLFDEGAVEDPLEDADDVGFNPAWQVGAVELVLSYPDVNSQDPTAGISAPDAFASGDAVTGMALAGPEEDGAADRHQSKILLVTPKGMDMLFEGCLPSGDCYVSQGPLIDVAFVKDSGSLAAGVAVFDETDFEIEAMKVFDVDGELKYDQASSPDPWTDFYKPFVLRNLAE